MTIWFLLIRPSRCIMITQRRRLVNSRVSNAMFLCTDQQEIDPALIFMAIKGRRTPCIIPNLEKIVIVKGEKDNFSIRPRIRWSFPLDGRLSVKIPHKCNVIPRVVTAKSANWSRTVCISPLLVNLLGKRI